MLKFKPVEDLEFSDDFMFCHLMKDKQICSQVLERLLGFKILDIKYPELQKTIAPYYESKGIRMDVYAEGSDEIFDIEMQSRNYDFIEKRARYYQSMLDMDALSKGAHYKSLKKSYILFICKKDPFGYNLPVYTLTQNFNNNTSFKYDDGTVKVFYNASQWETEKNHSLRALLHYISTSEPADNFTEELNDLVEETKIRELFKKEYMMSAPWYDDLVDEATEEGMAIGMAKGLEQGLQQGLQQGLEQGIEQGLQQGLEQGLQQGLERGIEQGIERGIEQGIERGKEEGQKAQQKQDIINLLKSGVSIEIISKAMGISREEILKISREK